MNASSPPDRRRHPRIAAVRPAKVYQHRAGYYAHARTSDYSHSGLQLEIVTPRPLTVGEPLSVAIAWGDEPVLAQRSMLPARVVRAGELIEGKQRIGVAFDAALATAAAA